MWIDLTSNRRSFIGHVIAGFSLAILLSLSGCNNPAARGPMPPPEPRSSKEFPRTEVVVHPDSPLLEGQNTLYCASFQLAWNRFADRFGKDGKWQEAIDSSLSRLLNDRPFEEKDLAANSVFTFAGILSPETKQEFSKALQSQFDGAKIPELPWNSRAPFAYALLEKSLHFKRLFDRLPARAFPIDKKDRVNYFGFDPDFVKYVRNQQGFDYSLLHYAGPDEFAVELLSDHPDECLVLTRMPRAESLSQAISEASVIASNDQASEWIIVRRLAIPVFHLGITREFEELFKAQSGNNPPVADTRPIAIQTIQFRLDEVGAVLKSKATFAAAASAEAREPKYVDLIFDQPFLLTLRYRESKHPYLAIWVENAEILEGE